MLGLFFAVISFVGEFLLEIFFFNFCFERERYQSMYSRFILFLIGEGYGSHSKPHRRCMGVRSSHSSSGQHDYFSISLGLSFKVSHDK